MVIDELRHIDWRHAALGALALLPLIGLLALGPIPQDPAYHTFVDARPGMGMPNALNVISNLPFLLIGIAGVGFCLKRKSGPVRNAWLVLFAGVALVGVGSAVFHWAPGNGTLVLDRIPMAVGFMGLLAALLGEFVDRRLASRLLLPLVVLGMGSVLYGYAFDDLRLYAWVQFAPLLIVLALVVLFRSPYTHQMLLVVALGWYGLAKAAEAYDAAVFEATLGLVSGHTLKHLLAAAACYTLLAMLRRRRSWAVAFARRDAW